jgi:hypothetical protein
MKSNHEVTKHTKLDLVEGVFVLFLSSWFERASN